MPPHAKHSVLAMLPLSGFQPIKDNQFIYQSGFSAQIQIVYYLASTINAEYILDK
jgi:hypothetical protein